MRHKWLHSFRYYHLWRIRLWFLRHYLGQPWMVASLHGWSTHPMNSNIPVCNFYWTKRGALAHVRQWSKVNKVYIMLYHWGQPYTGPGFHEVGAFKGKEL